MASAPAWKLPVTSTPSLGKSWPSTASPLSSTWRGIWPLCSGTRSSENGTRGRQSEYKFLVKTMLSQWSGWLPLFEWAEDWRARDGSHGTEHRKSFLRFYWLCSDWHLTLTHLYCPELGCDVVGLVSSPRRPSPHVSRYYTNKDLSEMMAGQDYLINVLPATAETNNILNRCICAVAVMVWWKLSIVALEITSNIAKMSASSTLVVETLSVLPTFSMLLTITSSVEPLLMCLMLNLFLKTLPCGLTKIF